MSSITLFPTSTIENFYKWKDIQTFLVRSQYNELLHTVMDLYTVQYYPKLFFPTGPTFPVEWPNPEPEIPNFLNRNYCLTIEHCFHKTTQGEDTIGLSKSVQETLASSKSSKSLGKPPDTSERQAPQAENEKDSRTCANETIDHLTLSPPSFVYERTSSVDFGQKIEPGLLTFGLTAGAVVWLYYYERMGIFKILGALLDDYNYKGKYTISGRRKDNEGSNILYSKLIDLISTLHRIGISSNLRDRITLYQRVLGVNIENKMGIDSERNTGFMDTFNRLIDYQLEYYKAKQLAQAIQSQQTGNNQPRPRSSVATQTSIRDTISVLKQHFEPLQYGRNQINTFLGIATVHATICLIRELKTEIGIPNQYNKPEEFIPAAYDILVAGKNSRTINVTNRFIIYDNCASYGYRLLTDIEAINLGALNTVETGSTLDLWLNDIEGWVEGYRNAYKSVTDKVEAIV